MATQLMTSLAEIESFRPCDAGWKRICEARKTANAAACIINFWGQQFPLSECLKSNSVVDVLWLISNRKVELQIAINAAHKFATSVNDLNNYWSRRAVLHAADATAAVMHAVAAAMNAADASIAAVAEEIGYAAAEDAIIKQKSTNKKLLLEAIQEYEDSLN